MLLTSLNLVKYNFFFFFYVIWFVDFVFLILIIFWYHFFCSNWALAVFRSKYPRGHAAQARQMPRELHCWTLKVFSVSVCADQFFFFFFRTIWLGDFFFFFQMDAGHSMSCTVSFCSRIASAWPQVQAQAQAGTGKYWGLESRPLLDTQGLFHLSVHTFFIFLLFLFYIYIFRIPTRAGRDFMDHSASSINIPFF